MKERTLITLYFLRHGIAEEAALGQPDSTRKLTTEGVDKMKREADALAKLDLNLDVIITSPYDRAKTTAEIVAKALDMKDSLVVDDRLAYGFRLSGLQAIVKNHPDVRRIMLVGHNPDFSVIPGQLTGGSAIEVKKGGIARVDLDTVEAGGGVLRWLIPPSVLLGGD